MRIPEGADRSEKKYQHQTYSNPNKAMGLCGFNGNDQRFMFLVELGERMNSGQYVGLMRKVADKIKRLGGSILQDRAKIHLSAKTSRFFSEVGVR